MNHNKALQCLRLHYNVDHILHLTIYIIDFNFNRFVIVLRLLNLLLFKNYLIKNNGMLLR